MFLRVVVCGQGVRWVAIESYGLCGLLLMARRSRVGSSTVFTRRQMDLQSYLISKDVKENEHFTSFRTLNYGTAILRSS